MKYHIRIIQILLLVFLSGILFNCDDGPCGKRGDSRLTIQNNSLRRIYFYFYWNYPDTTLGEFSPLTSSSFSQSGVGPNSSNVWKWPRKSCWEESFSIKPHEYIYIFDADTLETYSWQEIQDGYKILARYELTLQSLIDSSWVVNYPR